MMRIGLCSSSLQLSSSAKDLQGESLSLTEILKVLCQLTVFVERADVRDFLYLYCRDVNRVSVHQGVEIFF